MLAAAITTLAAISRGIGTGGNPAKTLLSGVQVLPSIDSREDVRNADAARILEKAADAVGLAVLAAAGEHTERIRLGTGVVSLPYHHPFNVAQRMVQLDHMTGGRAGWNLVTTSNRRRGSLSVHRLYHEQPLHLDVNLLISEFPVALADALDRVISHAAEAASRTSGPQVLVDTQVEAQAG